MELPLRNPGTNIIRFVSVIQQLVVGENANVDAFGGTDEAVEVAAKGAFPPAVAAAVADVNLGYAALAGEAENGVDGVFAIELGDFGTL